MNEVRKTAARCAVCPICFDVLHGQPERVIALTYEKRRVEAALYHRGCLVDPWGKLHMVLNRQSPVTRKEVDGFMAMPRASNGKAWTRFVDWNGDGRLDVSEVAAAIAVMFPVDEPRAAQLVRDAVDDAVSRNGSSASDSDRQARGDSGKKTTIGTEEVEGILRYIKAHVKRVSAALPRTSEPEISRNVPEAEFRLWFKYYTKYFSSCTNSLDGNQLRFALVACYFSALGEAPVATKEAVTQAFLEEAGLDLGMPSISEDEFMTRVVPVLRTNLPIGADSGVCPSEAPFDPKRPLSLRLSSMAGKIRCTELALGSTVGDLRKEACRLFRVYLNSTQPVLFFRGCKLECDSVLLTTLRGLVSGSTFQVMRGRMLPIISASQTLKMKSRLASKPVEERIADLIEELVGDSIDDDSEVWSDDDGSLCDSSVVSSECEHEGSASGSGIAGVESHTYLVDNTSLNSRSNGLTYRASRDFESRVADGSIVRWGATVVGADCKDGWLSVGNRFLPFRVNGVTVLVKKYDDVCDVPDRPLRVGATKPGDIEEPTRQTKHVSQGVCPSSAAQVGGSSESTAKLPLCSDAVPSKMEGVVVMAGHQNAGVDSSLVGFSRTDGCDDVGVAGCRSGVNGSSSRCVRVRVSL